jgi:phosphatidylserine/phosphatidylglycerophosphate/cardiolipin synthase-like enzyme
LKNIRENLEMKYKLYSSRKSLFLFTLILIGLIIVPFGRGESSFVNYSDEYLGFNPNEEIEVVTTIPVETSLNREGTRQASEVWLEMINRATKSLDIAQFYLATKNNELLEPIINAIKTAANRGIRIRILVGTPVNSEMEKNTFSVLDRFREHQNIKVKVFNWKELTGGILHAKYFIRDRKEIYVGSQNFDWRSLKHIHETGLRINHPLMAKHLTQIFEADWQYHSGDNEIYKKMNTQKSSVINKGTYLLASPEICNPPCVGSAIKALIHLINRAQKGISIQLLNYHVDIYESSKSFTIIDNALRGAAQRGVKIKLLVSDWNKREPGVKGLKALVEVPNIQVKFATIPPFSQGFIPYARVIHSKVMRIDHKISWIGTSNWGYNYFYKSRNVEVVTHSVKVAKILDKLFISLWNSKYSYPVQPDKEYTPPKIK